MSLAGIERFYFLGIGGIGMSALARYFKAKGFAVAGYDKTPSPLTHELETEGIQVHYEDLGENIPEAYRNVDSTMVIYTPAIPKTLNEFQFVCKQHQVLKRSEVLGLITQTSKGLGVAGTHGKTTTSTMLAYVLSQSSKSCSAFLGGISTNFNTNVLIEPKAEFAVIEADEYDRSFLKLSPFASIITAIDPDHLDIYGTEEAFIEGFQTYADKHKGMGLLVHKHGLPIVNTGFRALTYGVEMEEASVVGNNFHVEQGQFMMDVRLHNQQWKQVVLGLPGIHNAENALAVIALCHDLGLSEQEIRKGLQTFKGVKRRFEYHVRTPHLVYIDDYAHHPTEIKALVSSVRSMYPTQQLVGVFQPHLFSRTRDFEQGFIEELAKLDQVIVMPIYPAREEPIPGVTSDRLVEKIGKHAKLMTPEEVLDFAKSFTNGVFLTIGAGDIDRIVPTLANTFKANH
jgi:UDP-N-acetylmuramate--alanine ligase